MKKCLVKPFIWTVDDDPEEMLFIRFGETSSGTRGICQDKHGNLRLIEIERIKMVDMFTEEGE
jgi:hypothetical protein